MSGHIYLLYSVRSVRSVCGVRSVCSASMRHFLQL